MLQESSMKIRDLVAIEIGNQKDSTPNTSNVVSQSFLFGIFKNFNMPK
jgi:hypothetical protein